MPLGELATGFFEIIGRFMGQLFIEIIFEFLVKGAGYVIVRLLLSSSKKDIDPDSGIVIFVGIAFWLLTGLGIYWIYSIYWVE